MPRRVRSRPRRLVAVTALCLAATLTAGCGGSPTATTTSTPPAAASPTATGLSGTPAPPSPAPPPSPSASSPRPTHSAQASPTATPTPTHSTARSTSQPSPCVARLADGLGPRAEAGQLLLVGVDSTGLSTATAAILRNRDIGSAFLVSNSTAGVAAIRRLTDALRKTANRRTGMLVAADQEGGLVQRLQGAGFDRIPSAEDQARLSTSTLRRDAKHWGEQLDAAGVDVDLAPVADVVPAWLGTGNAPIGALHRGYGPDPATVATHVTAFIKGMRAAGRGTTAKHFPGLGQVRGNTDYSGGVVDDRTTRHDPYLRSFAAAIHAGVPLVMVSLATYTRIDPKRRAVFSRTIVTGMLRHQLGFRGVIVSDDLGAAAEVASVPPGKRALEFLAAGGDLITVVAPSVAAQMSAAITEQIRSDPHFAVSVREKVVRVLTLKQHLGLLRCG